MSAINLLITSFPFLLKGTATTILISILSIIFALVIGLSLAIMRISGVKSLERFAQVYVSFFRGTPLLVQLFIVYFGFANIIRFTPFQAIVIGLSFHFGAYISESFRAAVLSVSIGQWEAAGSLGVSPVALFRDIIFPQAWPRAIPSVWNSLIDIVKSSSLASVVTVEELTSVADQISSASAVVLPILLEAAAIYWCLTTILNILQNSFERRYKYIKT